MPRRYLPVVVVVAAVLFLAAFLTLRAVRDDTEATAPPGPGVTAQQVNDDPSAFFNKELTVRGEVTLGDVDAFVLGDEGLVVVPRDARMLPEYAIGSKLIVDGTLYPLDRYRLEELTEVDLDTAPNVEDMEQGDPILIADNVRVVADSEPPGR